MRTITSPERALLASAHANFYLRVEVKDSVAAWRDLTALGGVDYVDSVTWSASIDTAVMTGSVTLKREQGGISLSPLLSSSSLNTPGPFLDVGRGIRISTAVTAHATAPVSGDWKEVFLGLVTDIDFAGDPITLTISDLGAALTDLQIETLKVYGDVGGIPVEAVMQNILDDNAGAGVYTLVTPTSPTWNILPYQQLQGSVLEAIRALALQIGWDVRYVYNASNVFALTFYSPNRAKTTPDATIGPDEYLNVSRLAISNADVRNVCKVNFQDKTTLVVASAEASDSGSIAEFGRRYMEIGEGSSSNIDTLVEAQAMATAAVSDLSEPLADQAIEQFYFWPVQLGDLLAYTANGVHYDTNQAFGVVSYSHTLSMASHRTTITVRGKVAGAYRQWLLTRNGEFSGQITTGPAPEIFPLLAEANAFEDPTRDGMAWQQVKFEVLAAKIDIYAVENATGGPGVFVPIPELSATRLAYSLERQEGDKWNAPDQTFIVGIATRASYYRKTICLGVGYDGARGPTVANEAQAVDVGTPPSGPPTGFSVTSSGTANRVVWTVADSLAYTLLFRNGYGIVLQPGEAAFLDTNINSSIAYSYRVCHWRNGQTSAFAGTGIGGAPPPPVTVPPVATAVTAPTWTAGYPVSTGTNGVDYRWTADGATTEIAIEVSVFTIISGVWSAHVIFPSTDVTHVPSGAYVDTGFPAGTTLQARIRALVSGVYYYSAPANVRYGVPTATPPPTFVGGSPNRFLFSLGVYHTAFYWTMQDATWLTAILELQDVGLTTFTTLYTQTNMGGLTSGNYISTSDLGGRKVRLVLTYTGGGTASTPLTTVF